MMESHFQSEHSDDTIHMTEYEELKDDNLSGRKRSRLQTSSSDETTIEFAYKLPVERSDELAFHRESSVDSKPSPGNGSSEQSYMNETIKDNAAERSATEPIELGTSFPEQLMEIINSGEFEDAIRWSVDGRSFGLIPKLFIQTVLKTEFQGTQIESFQRKLSRWKFSRCLDDAFPPEAIVYRHEWFRKDKPELVQRLASNKKKAISDKKINNKLVKAKTESSLTTTATSATPGSSKGEHAHSKVSSPPQNRKVEGHTEGTMISQDTRQEYSIIDQTCHQHNVQRNRVQMLPTVVAAFDRGTLPETAAFDSNSFSLELARRSFMEQLLLANNNGGAYGLSSDMTQNSALLRLTMGANNLGQWEENAHVARSLQERQLVEDSILQRAVFASVLERARRPQEELLLQFSQTHQQHVQERLIAGQQNLIGMPSNAQLASLQGAPNEYEASALELYLRQLNRRYGPPP